MRTIHVYKLLADLANSKLRIRRGQLGPLGIFDGRWLSEEHFRWLATTLVGAACLCLGRQLSNLGGASVVARQFYKGFVFSIALYSAPVWVAALTAQNMTRLWWPQRILAFIAIRGYSTVSTEGACALANTSSWIWRRNCTPKFIGG